VEFPWLYYFLPASHREIAKAPGLGHNGMVLLNPPWPGHHLGEGLLDVTKGYEREPSLQVPDFTAVESCLPCRKSRDGEVSYEWRRSLGQVGARKGQVSQGSTRRRPSGDIPVLNEKRTIPQKIRKEPEKARSAATAEGGEDFDNPLRGEAEATRNKKGGCRQKRPRLPPRIRSAALGGPSRRWTDELKTGRSGRRLNLAQSSTRERV